MGKVITFGFKIRPVGPITQLLGEFDVKIDDKGRMRMPSSLLKQVGGSAPFAFVLNRGFEKCLMLYPQDVWDHISAEVNQLNIYNKKNRDFVRYFYRGATKVETDAADRILLNKRLLDYAGIDKDAVMFAYNDRIEIWAKESYDQLMADEPFDFSDLAEEVLGNAGQKPDRE